MELRDNGISARVLHPTEENGGLLPNSDQHRGCKHYCWNRNESRAVVALYDSRYQRPPGKDCKLNKDAKNFR